MEIISLCKKLKDDKVFYSIIDQLIRSSTSIGANVIEAQAASSKNDYIKFFQIALKSSNETTYWLLLVRESEKRHSETCDKLLNELKEISCILGSSLLTLKRKK